MRSSLIVLAAALAFATAAHAAPKPVEGVHVATMIVSTWTCQDQLRVPRSPVTKSPWKLKRHSEGYKRALLAKRTERRDACRKVLHAYDDDIRRLQRGLSGTPMDGSAGDLIAAARAYRISPFFIAAIAGTESSFGAAACRNNRFNAFGLSSCGSGWSVPYFRSWREAYFFMGAFLTGRTRVTSGWPNARTTMDYHGYAACSDCWGRKTAMHMRQRFGVGPDVRYR